MLVKSQNVFWTVQAPPVILENSLGAAKKENLLIAESYKVSFQNELQ